MLNSPASRPLPGRLDGVFLDLYGTLTAGDRAAVHAACALAVADLRLPTTADEFAVRWGELFFTLVDESNHDGFRTLADCERVSLIATAEHYGARIDPTRYVDLLEAYWRNPPVHEEVAEVLAALPVPACIVSNADTAGALAALERNGLRMAHVVTSQEARHYKPHGAIFEFALARTGWRADRVLHVGDSLHSDVMGAKNAGLHAAWVCREDRIHDIGRTPPDHTFRDLRGLLALLGGGKPVSLLSGQIFTATQKGLDFKRFSGK